MGNGRRGGRRRQIEECGGSLPDGNATSQRGHRPTSLAFPPLGAERGGADPDAVDNFMAPIALVEQTVALLPPLIALAGFGMAARPCGEDVALLPGLEFPR